MRVQLDGTVIDKGNFKNGKHHGEGVIKLDDGTTYTGHLVDGLYDGEGELVQKDNALLYKGGFSKGQYHGEGKLDLSKFGAGKYEGGFELGRYQGYGILTKADSTKYEGAFEKGQYEGYGRLTLPDGSFYEGTFSHNELEGKVIYSDKNGADFTGIFQKGELVGKWTLHNAKGAVTTPDGATTYEGTFSGGTGSGELRATDRNYVGQFVAGLFEGQGSLKLLNENITYVGNFKAGEFDGKGTLILPDGTRYSGSFKAGKYEGQGQLTNPDGTSYSGRFKAGQPTGIFARKRGVVKDYVVFRPLPKDPTQFDVWCTYIGTATEYAGISRGVLIHPSGAKYEGFLKEGMPSGKGVLEIPKPKMIFTGTFMDGKFTGNLRIYKDGSFQDSLVEDFQLPI